MDGLVIVVLTAGILLGGAFLLSLIPRLFYWTASVFERKGTLGKILIIVPLIVLGILSIITGFIVLLIVAATALYAAHAFRNWWHK